MSFSYRYRKPISLVTLAAVFLATAVTPASAEYIPQLGRYMQRDPNGMALALAPDLGYHGSNPTITVSMAYELQYADGMNFYEFLRSNPPNGTDPSGMFSLPDVLVSASIYGGAVGGMLGWMRTYSTFSDRGSNWRLAAGTFIGAGIGSGSAFGMGLLAGAIAAGGTISLGAAVTSVGLMFSPPTLGLTVAEYQYAETPAERLMAKIDMGVAGASLLLSHISLAFVSPRPVGGLAPPSTEPGPQTTRIGGPRRYTLNLEAMKKHLTGSLKIPPGENRPNSQFLFKVDANEVVLRAARYADEANLWTPEGKARVQFDDYIGVLGDAGVLTKWVQVTRKESGFVHGWPARPK